MAAPPGGAAQAGIVEAVLAPGDKGRAAFGELLAALQVPDNAARSQAEALLEAARAGQPAATLGRLVEVRPLPPPHARSRPC